MFLCTGWPIGHWAVKTIVKMVIFLTTRSNIQEPHYFFAISCQDHAAAVN